jgi:hypothetical protein
MGEGADLKTDENVEENILTHLAIVEIIRRRL